MAKDKARKIKIPKEIAGVKIPKALRDSGKAAIKMAQDPSTRAMVSAGLMAAASMMAARKQARSAPAPDAANPMADAAEAAAQTAQQIGAALIGAASTAAERFFGVVDAPATPTSGKGGGEPPEAAADIVSSPTSETDAGEATIVPPAVAASKKVSAKTAKAIPSDVIVANGGG